MDKAKHTTAGLTLIGNADANAEFAEILSPDAIAFIAKLQRKFGDTRVALLANRAVVQEQITAGIFPTFCKETREIRSSEWQVAAPPPDLLDRRVEITGPVDRKMVINALNSKAQTYMADFEDSHSPTWRATLEGQANLRDAIRGTIKYQSPEGKSYALAEKTAVLLMRPRGWHLVEKHVLVDEKPISASLFDFGLYFFHNARALIKNGTAPYFYLPKMESYLEARLWNEVFCFAQQELGLARGTIRATVLIETILAAFQMDEILYELKDHSSGLNCGRWDYIFSFIKKFHAHAEFVLPDRNLITMNVHFLKSYCQLLIQTCHRRGAHAMGGMAAQIPIKNDPAANEIAMNKVRADKEREVQLGHDGTWVAHPGLVPIAREAFDAAMKGPNQVAVKHPEWKIDAADLLAVPTGAITQQGLRTNVNIGLLYLESWLRGTGCVPLYNLMEDAATAEISRAQVWQWVHHKKFTRDEFKKILREESSTNPATSMKQAAEIMDALVCSDSFTEFLTLPAYEFID